jgi:hypothetical protein
MRAAWHAVSHGHSLYPTQHGRVARGHLIEDQCECGRPALRLHATRCTVQASWCTLHSCMAYAG